QRVGSVQQLGGKVPLQSLAVPEGEAVQRALLAAFPDRVARRREAGGRRGVMVGGRGVRLAPSSGVTGPELFVCVDVDAGQRETLVRQAAARGREGLPAAAPPPPPQGALVPPACRGPAHRA